MDAIEMLCNLTLNPVLASRNSMQSQNNAHFVCFLQSEFNWIPWPQSASELYRPCNRRLAKLVSTFAARLSHVVSVTDHYWPYSRFSRPEPLLVPVSSSVVLTSLSVPRSRPAASQNPDLWISSQELWPLDHKGCRFLQSWARNTLFTT
jgi:hypothetical protein